MAINITNRVNVACQIIAHRLLTVKGSGVCFSYPVPLPQLKLQMSRNAWGATEETIILIETANVFTLTPL